MPYDRITASPHWEWWLVLYFFLGGIAGGAYFIACLVELAGDEQDREVVKPAYYLALPIILLCSVFLIIDLGRPERFWHMILQSETFLPMFKYWSPMSYGSWILSIFGAFAGVSFVRVLVEDNRFGLGRFRGLTGILRLPFIQIVFNLLGMLAAFGLASYTGTLLSASNQPVWSDSSWISPLFFASGVSSGIALMLLLRRKAPHNTLQRLEWADGWAIGLELALLVAFLLSLGSLAGALLGSPYGIALLIGTVLLGLVIPLALRFVPRLLRGYGPLIAACLVLVGGFVLRYSVLMAGQELVVRGH